MMMYMMHIIHMHVLQCAYKIMYMSCRSTTSCRPVAHKKKKSKKSALQGLKNSAKNWTANTPPN